MSAIAVVLSNWHNVLGAIQMASSKSRQRLFLFVPNLDSENPGTQGEQR